MADGQKKSRTLVGEAAEALRVRVLAAEAGERIGSLPDLVAMLNVGVVTVQQAVRILEHEGLLETRRGPGGGFYGARPDAAAIERAVSVFLRTNPASFEEALNITSLLFVELVGEAANCRDERLLGELAALARRLDGAGEDSVPGGNRRGDFEYDFQNLLFRIVRWPLFELLTQVTLGYAVAVGGPSLKGGEAWTNGRRRIIAAILSGDVELARFEADRSNRRLVMSRLRDRTNNPGAAID